MDASCYSPGKEYKNPGKDSKGKYFPGDYTTLKEGADDKSPLALFMHNSEKIDQKQQRCAIFFSTPKKPTVSRRQETLEKYVGKRRS